MIALSAPGALTPATNPKPSTRRTRRIYTSGSADIPVVAPGVIADQIIASVVAAWDVAIWGQLDAAWLPSVFARPEGKFGALISAINAAARGVSIAVDRPSEPTRLTISRPGAAPVVIEVEMSRRLIYLTGSPAFSMASPGVARRLLEVLAARIADLTAQEPLVLQ